MVEQKINSGIDQVLQRNERESSLDEVDEQGFTLSNLIYYKTILDEHLQRIRENITSVEIRGDPSWPRATAGKNQENASESAESLLTDFNYLWERAQSLSNTLRPRCRYCWERCYDLGVTKGGTSLFGMDFKQFGQEGGPSLWV